MLSKSYKKAYAFLYLLIFFNSALLSFSLDRVLLRDISSQNKISTEHFYVYWSDDYELTYPWLVDVEGIPLYIATILKKSEELYQSFLDDGFDMPQRIEIYVANTGMTADGLLTNSIASLGAFTSDDYPEILINANISQKSLANDIKRILSHEMMHVVQFQNGIIKGEDTTPKEVMWFSEGLAVLSETYFMNDTKYMNEYCEYIFYGIFFDTSEYINSYTNGYLFYYLMKRYGYQIKEFINIYKINDTHESFLSFIASQNGISYNELLNDIYNSFIYSKSMYGEDFFINNELVYGSKQYNKKLNNGWNLISIPFNFIGLNFLNQSSFLVWIYKNGKWMCSSNDETVEAKCLKNFGKFYELDKRDGFWIYLTDDIELDLKYFD